MDDENELEGFTFEDAERVVAIYACSQCEGDLSVIPIDWQEDLYYVVCPDCGNIEIIGRISKTTVAIRNERGIWDFPKVIRALPELWGGLIPTKEEHEKTIHELGF